MRNVTSFVVAALVAACGSDQSAGDPPAAQDAAAPQGGQGGELAAPEPDAASSPDASPSPDAAAPEPDMAPPPPPPPEVWGTVLLADENPDPAVFEATLTAGVTTVTLDDGTDLEVWAYNGLFPGPRIDVRAGERVIVHFTNNLPEATTIHWHGLRITDQMDGNPRIQDPVQPGATFTYDFVPPEPGTFWYHPHVGANEQVERGLYAPLVVRAADEPVWDAERAFLLDDALIDNGRFAPFMAQHMEEMHGRFGNVLVTNGHVLALADTVPQGRLERWHLVNPANARTTLLRLRGAEWQVVATDGGPLEAAYTPEMLAISPGQRFELEVRYSTTGQAVLESLVDTVDANDQLVTVPVPLFEAEVAAGEAAAPEWRFVPAEPRESRRSTRRELLELNGAAGPDGHLVWTINDEAHGHGTMFTFEKGDIVDFTLRNMAGPEHPFHLHGQFFEIYPDNDALRAQPGLKDVVLVPGLETVRIRAYLDNPGEWMMHCHILEHAELGMMATFVVNE